MEVQSRTIFEGYFGDKLKAFALTEGACRLIITHSCYYGEDEPYSLGTEWGEQTWHIVKRTCLVLEANGELKGDWSIETAHVCWRCPQCGKWYSDDHADNSSSPYLTCCSCGVRNQNNYILVNY